MENKQVKKGVIIVRILCIIVALIVFFIEHKAKKDGIIKNSYTVDEAIQMISGYR